MSAENLYIPTLKWWLIEDQCHLSKPSVIKEDHCCFECISHDGRNISSVNITYSQKNVKNNKIVYGLTFNHGEPLNKYQSLLQQILQHFLQLRSSDQQSFLNLYDHTSNQHSFSQHAINNFILG